MTNENIYDEKIAKKPVEIIKGHGGIYEIGTLKSKPHVFSDYGGHALSCSETEARMLACSTLLLQCAKWRSQAEECMQEYLQAEAMDCDFNTLLKYETKERSLNTQASELEYKCIHYIDTGEWIDYI
jgi:hypothetical protein